MAVSKKRRKKKKKKQTKTVTNSLKIFIFHTNEASIWLIDRLPSLKCDKKNDIQWVYSDQKNSSFHNDIVTLNLQ